MSSHLDDLATLWWIRRFKMFCGLGPFAYDVLLSGVQNVIFTLYYICCLSGAFEFASTLISLAKKRAHLLPLKNRLRQPLQKTRKQNATLSFVAFPTPPKALRKMPVNQKYRVYTSKTPLAKGKIDQNLVVSRAFSFFHRAISLLLHSHSTNSP